MNSRMKPELKKCRALFLNVTRVLSGANSDQIGLNVIHVIANSNTRIEEYIRLDKTRNKPDFKGNMPRNLVKSAPIFPGGASVATSQFLMHICITSP